MDDAVPLRTAEHLRLSGRALRFLTDEKLAAMVAAGNDDAFATLYGRHHQAIYRYCLSLLRQEADARDALQGSMLSALSSLRARPIEGQFKPWLFRIAHNESISIIRGRAREAPTEAPATTAFVDDRETREELRTLVSDIGALPDRQRGAIVMRELSGLTYTEIAAALGTSEAGGKQLVYEARSALQDLRAGHEMSCELVRERISAADRRLLRGRKIRAHLRSCAGCQDFERGIDRRRAAFALFAPPLAPLAAAGVLQDVLGAGGGASAGGAAAGATGIASAGAPLAGPAVLKLAAATLLAGAAGVGAYEAATAILNDSVPATHAAPAAGEESPALPGGREAGGESGHGARGASRGDAAETSAAANGHAGGGAPGRAGGSESSPAGNDAAAPGATAGGQDDPAGPGAPGDGSAGGGGGTVDPPPPAPSPPSEPPPPPGGGGSGVAPGTPPGHGGTPPGQGGTPPGQAGSDISPGHLGKPGKPKGS